MPDMEFTPFDHDAQRAVSRMWDRVVDGRLSLSQTPARALVRDSWERSLSASVRADLPQAPLVLADSSLRHAQERADWVPFALRAAQNLSDAFTNGHILSLFDAEGRMLSCNGDSAVLDGLAAINFRPGGLWTESAVGTNGPGTALATRRPVHIVGAEHFCEAWQGWHCAAVPLADATSTELLGVIDISGFSRNAHPHTLQLAMSLAASVREMLTARDMEQRCSVLQRFAGLSSRYAQDAMIAVDRYGRVVMATDAAPDGLRPGTATPSALRAALAEHVRSVGAHAPVDGSTEVFLSLGHDIGLSALSFPVMEGERAVGACLLLRSDSPRRGDVRLSTGVQGTMTHASRAPERATPRRETRYALEHIVGVSQGIVDARRLAGVAAGNALPVLLLGESGTGKEVFAQAIHHASARRDRPFIAVNCAALPADLIEAELFGYVGGAFTGARREGSAGKFRAADGGTIFLDEISEMSYGAQASLLRVLQEQEICAVGSSESRRVNVRVIAATNRDVQTAVRDGRLRVDLYYRLNVLAIELPALRDRAADIPMLAEHLLARAAAELGRPRLRLTLPALHQLASMSWPGNVRELENVLRRAAALAHGDSITVAELPAPRPNVPERTVRSSSVMESAAGIADQDERARTIHAMRSARSMRDAAEELGINRSTLYRRLERYGLKAERLLNAQ